LFVKEGLLFIQSSENNAQQVWEKTSTIFQHVSQNYFSTHSLFILLISILAALVLGRVIATSLRNVVGVIGKRADKSQNLRTVNRLRRYETILVLCIASIRSILVLFAIYFWWAYIHPSGHSPGIIGASALLIIVLGGALGPPMRDIAAGSLMMAEHWYGVGDHIRVEPFADMQGVVERISLRSTRIRGLNGEIMWVNNQYVQGVRLAPKGIRTMALEMFVDDLAAGEKLIEKTNKRLPTGPLLITTPLSIISNEKVGDKLWQITAIGETAAGREWLIEQSAVELIKWMDEQSKMPVLAHGPLSRYADSEAERRYIRTIKNARKRPSPKRRLVKKTNNKS
jgi:hypothetical protein